MNTEHILIYPNKIYGADYANKTTDNLRVIDYINYGYIKLRDLNKWLNNEVVSVKMGMLTPSNKSYRGLTILDSVIKRIKEQDTTALFDDEDELIPIYVFVSTETDKEWREYLISNGFVSARKNASREGLKIRKTDIGYHYGKHYDVETDETRSEKEETEKKIKTRYEKNKKYFEETLGYGRNTYDKFRAEQEQKLLRLDKKGKFTLDEKTLEIKGYEVTSKTTLASDDIFCGIFFACLAIILLCLSFTSDTLLFDGFFFRLTAIISALLSVFPFAWGDRVTKTEKTPIHIDVKGKHIKQTSYISEEPPIIAFIAIIICLIGALLGFFWT